MIRCGWEGRRSGEDESTTGAILHRMREKGAGLDERVERVVGLYLACPKKSSLRCNSAARRLIRLGYEQDLDFCLAENALRLFPFSKGVPSSTVDRRKLGPRA
jgi:2-phosphosulfolactate phosphatase